MASFNKVVLMGNLTRDPELRQAANSTVICKASVAVNESYVDKDGNRRENPVFVEVCAFGTVAENIQKHFFKGSPILIEGRLNQQNWEDKKTGEKRSKLVVIVEKFAFVGSRAEASGGGKERESGGNARGARSVQRDFIDERRRAWESAPDEALEALEDDDLPF